MTATASRVDERFTESRAAAEAFFAANAATVARACREMAARFDRGGRLLVLGERAAASDAHHVAVEFVHPILVGKRALPALALTQPLDETIGGWSKRLGAVARDGDIVLALSHDATGSAVSHALQHARQRGLLTLEMNGGDRAASDADFTFTVPQGDTLVAQEVQETAYHVIWELVHVFLGEPTARTSRSTTCAPDADGRGHCSICGDEATPGLVLAVDDRTRSATVMMDGAEREIATDLVEGARVGDTLLVHQGFAISAVPAAPDLTRDLYPFLYDEPAAQNAVETALEAVRVSTLAKCAEVVSLREAMLREYGRLLPECAEAVASRLRSGGKLLAFGNGGSATDAEDVAADCQHPARDGWRMLPALALTEDVAVLSAIANDVGFDNVFARQIVAFADAIDIAIGFSTSGNSPNVVLGLREARHRGVLTIALSGDSGGELAQPGAADYCFVARATSLPRIQEAHATVWHALLDLVQERLA